ncbi:translation-associated GTPase [Burkholderia mallei]|uniref:Translation-associated GTPase n=2 Tax=pseudomallei group TaxID=111527 RepID=A0AAX1XBM5_BURML|nr:conserved hypothetical protein [Burkholderia pseudomallei MSHR346]ARK51564.1 translation-associated GTPase [Burkholderia pseudomallei]EBA45446.1 hypothetical protein BURPS305_1816 [Burkholderia pseudomallei 305]EEH30933.1 conserved hypothetical protein [Burkholderia pseudomallei Pakistan 9]EXI99964.1 translation-associated GTPase [Burkholderia pseudomallei MSHR6137]PNW96464.1 translation-associated GTPase [Burkholderia sp. 136(2017)]PNX11598.1 translation-associated GTPase [Burkholderia sp
MDEARAKSSGAARCGLCPAPDFVQRRPRAASPAHSTRLADQP